MIQRITVLLCIGLILSGCRKTAPAGDSPEAVTLRIGHVGHDHQVALYVALDNWQDFADTGLTVTTIEDRKYYDLYDKGRLVSHIEVVPVGGGSLMPTSLAQGVIDIGFGGVAAVMAAVDSGAPVRLISPLHSKGDMFVVPAASPIQTWPDLVAAARAAEKPLRIGYKDPSAVAKLILEEALKHEGIPYGHDVTRQDVKVHLINVKGGGKLNVSLGTGLIDGYVGNNPFCAIAVEEKIGRIVCDLEDLPPGNFRNHPCCCIGANETAIAGKAEAITAVLVLCKRATDLVNSDTEKAVDAAVHWLGTSQAVERMSIPTSGYSMTPDATWLASMEHWFVAMDGLGQFTGKLKGLAPSEVAAQVYDMDLISQVERHLEQARN